MASSIENLREMRTQLEGIYEHLPRIGLSADRPPILDVLESDRANADNEEDISATASTSGKTSPSSSGGGGVSTTTKDRESDVLRQPHASDGIPGLRVFRESVRHDIEQIDKFLARHAARGVSLSTTTTTFSTNAPYLIAVWNELIRAPPPVLFVDKTFPAPSEKKQPPQSQSQSQSKTFSKKGATGAKVDVVADNGRRWIRINTIKTSRLLAEFRELDSYLTESESEEEEEECSSADCTCAITCGAKSARAELDNSLLQMGRALASAAQSSLSTSSGEDTPPKVTLRLTRLLLGAESLFQLENLGLKVIGPRHCSITSDLSETDPRIAQTIRELLKMGLEIELGEHEFTIPPELLSTFVKRRRRRLVPSRQINLDLSVLIALVSDLTHAPLPVSTEEAYARYIPTPAERARSRRRRRQQKALLARAKAQSEASKNAAAAPTKKKEKDNAAAAISKEAAAATASGNSESDDEGESVHSRALANQVLREMDVALLDEIAGRLEVRGDDALLVEFWTSREARERCLRIVDKIGGPGEKRRASALLVDRRAPNEPVLGIQHASISDAADAYWRDSRHPRDAIPTLAPLHVIEDESDDGLQRQTDTVGSNQTAPDPFWINLERACFRLLSEGARVYPRAFSLPTTKPNGIVDRVKERDTDSAEENSIERASVTRGNPRLTAHTVSTLGRGAVRRWTTLTANRASVRKMLKESAKEAGRASLGLELEACEEGEEEVAAIWVVEPRSLAEGMRGDFVP